MRNAAVVLLILFPNQWLYSMAIKSRQLISHFLGDENYYMLRAQRSLWEATLRRQDHLFVHTMGKVGSSSIMETLKRLGFKQRMALHWTHFLSDEGLALLIELYEDGYGGWARFPQNIKIHVQKSRALNRAVKQWSQKGKRSKVITLVREPIRTNISGFFQNHTWWPAELTQQCQAKSPGYLEALATHFFTTYPHHVPLTWFDWEIRDLFGVDVFAQPFPHKQGYQIYHGERTDVLVIKLESLNDCVSKAFEEFLGIKNFTLIRENTASDKWYSDLYREFVNQVQMPTDYQEQMRNSRYARYFYGDVLMNNELPGDGRPT